MFAPPHFKGLDAPPARPYIAESNDLRDGKLQAMENFIKGFARDGDGAWLCLEPVELNLPSGRIQVTAGTRFTRGTDFMGVDVARLLDEAQEKSRLTS